MSKIDSGYEGTNVPDDFSIPPCGIEDVDRAIFNLFDKTLILEVQINEKSTKVPVVFASGERFALTRRRQPLRDRNGALILPVVAIRRKSIEVSPTLGNYGTAISPRDQGYYAIRRKLSKEDRDYQKIINKLRIKNQENVASRGNFGSNEIFPGNRAKPGALASRRNRNNLSFQINDTGNLLEKRLGDNIFEIITIPYPEFFLADYEVTFWTQYTIHMNQLLEVMMANFNGQDIAYQLTSDSGYEFTAFVQPSLTSGDNFDNFTDDERIIRYSFDIKVPAYLIAPDQPGLPSPFRKFLSAPQIEFITSQVSAPIIKTVESPDGDGDIDRFILSDVELLTSTGKVPLARGQDGAQIVDIVQDPFTGKEKKRLLRVLTRNQRSGESVISSRIVVDLETIT